MLGYDLLYMWENNIFPAEAQKLPEVRLTSDDKFVQASFEVSGSTRVTLINNNGKAVRTYGELDALELSESDEAAVKARILELEKNPNFENRDQLLITKAIYNTINNSFSLEAVKTKYAVLNTLATKRFPIDSKMYQTAFYKTGVMTPFITCDDYTFFMERKADKLYSAASGFLEPIGKEQKLSGDNGEDIIVWNARNEAMEEFLENEKGEPRFTCSKPIITGVSVRKSPGGIGTIEFILPMFLPYCSKNSLELLLSSNIAPDKHEHTDKFISAPLDSCYRDRATTFLQAAKPGCFLYHPMLVGASRLVGKGVYGDTIPGGLPYSRSKIIPLESLRSCVYNIAGWVIKHEDKRAKEVLELTL